MYVAWSAFKVQIPKDIKVAFGVSIQAGMGPAQKGEYDENPREVK